LALLPSQQKAGGRGRVGGEGEGAARSRGLVFRSGVGDAAAGAADEEEET